MDTSIELLTSMSPKIKKPFVSNKNRKNIAPTKLTLKKYFARRSNVCNGKRNEIIITVPSESETESSTSSSNSSQASPIVISDSEVEDSFTTAKSTTKQVGTRSPPNNHKNSNRLSGRLSQDKFDKIKDWIEDVNNEGANATLFSQISTISDQDNPYFKAPGKNIAACSTFIEPSSKRLDELFKKPLSDDNKKTDALPEIKLINSSLITEDLSIEEKKDIIDDSFELKLNDENQAQKQQSVDEEIVDPNDPGQFEELLDSLYGDSWRERKNEVLPVSEPKPKRKENKIKSKVPNTERPRYKNPYLQTEPEDNLLKTLQKAKFKQALESPWANVLKKLCDSDTESDDSAKNLQPKKLVFDNDSDSNERDKSDSISKLTNTFKNKVQISHDLDDKSNKKVRNESTLKQQKKQSQGPYSFLASLSKDVPTSKCDMSALIYKNNFKLHKEKLAKKLFDLYNEKIFDNAIPGDTPLEWNDRMTGTAGYCYCKKITRRTGAIERTVRIVLSTKVVDSADRLRDTLVHELCHAVTWIVNQISDGHGSFWKSWADHAMKIFPELPQIRRCHQYVINTKYTYRCMDCGYSIGRHSKSLNIERKRCGYCYGKFEVLINKTTKKGETKTVPVTPKKPPTGFALFVKENYAAHKQSGLNHGDVMKILGQKFAELKCDKS